MSDEDEILPSPEVSFCNGRLSSIDRNSQYNFRSSVNHLNNYNSRNSTGCQNPLQVHAPVIHENLLPPPDHGRRWDNETASENSSPSPSSKDSAPLLGVINDQHMSVGLGKALLQNRIMAALAMKITQVQEPKPELEPTQHSDLQPTLEPQYEQHQQCDSQPELDYIRDSEIREGDYPLGDSLPAPQKKVIQPPRASLSGYNYGNSAQSSTFFTRASRVNIQDNSNNQPNAPGQARRRGSSVVSMLNPLAARVRGSSISDLLKPTLNWFYGIDNGRGSITEGQNRQVSSVLVADHYITSSPEYKALINRTRPIAIIMYCALVFFAPLVFRYAVSSYMTSSYDYLYVGTPGNATISMTVPWNRCELCDGGVKGITLQNFTVTVSNINGPFPNDFTEGFPSVAIFGSHDMKEWFNFYSPQQIDMPMIYNLSTTTILVNQSTGAACLGQVEVSYLVVCLNNYYLADSLTKGQSIAPPPFNDRCTQVYGMCGVPCAELKDNQYPHQCPSGVINQDLLADLHNTTVKQFAVHDVDIVWFNGMNWVDWVILTAILLDCFSNILRFLPILSGAPSEHSKSVADVVVYGKVVLCCTSPFAGEREGIFLRSLIGRTSTAFHSAGSRHNLRALYMDTVINEDSTNAARFAQWTAWIEFLDVLCSFRLEDMEWKETWRKASPAAPKRYITVAQGETKSYLCDASAIDFEGLTDVATGSTETDYSRSLADECQISKDMSKAKKVNMIDILPAVCFLDGWLEAIKASEPSYPNYNNAGTFALALQAIFNVAPCQKYFPKKHFGKIHDALGKLWNAFGNSTMKRHPKAPIYRDFKKEYLWRISRGEDMPTVDLAWIFFQRSKIDGDQPRQVANSTRKSINSIVYITQETTKPNVNPLNIWLDSRSRTYQIKKITKQPGTSVRLAHLVPWPAVNPNQKDVESNSLTSKCEIVPMSQVELITKNRGKAGALNMMLEYMRHRTKLWAFVTGHDYLNDPIQQLFAIIDARHMVAEPEVFWNDALPYFSRNRQTGLHTKNLGEINTSVILVQYPQYFSNVGTANYLDNKNSAYYVIWQTLRDCSKTITSSGTNAIWDASDPNFICATTCRIEDTATTQNYLEKYYTVHLPVFVANGIAKDTEDYIEAVYRWSTGAVELFWSTIFDSSKISHFVIVGQIFVFFAVACFVPTAFAYYVWVLFAVTLGMIGYFEKRFNRRPFRSLNVSATIVLNCFSWVSNLLSFIWLAMVPISISFFRYAPLANTGTQAVTWSLIAIGLRVPPGIILDRLIQMAQFLSPKTANPKEFNFNMEIWRSNQLYACSLAYAALSVICGTYSSFRGYFMNQDNTFWVSFQNKDGKWWLAILHALSSPDFLTRILAITLLTIQFACLVNSFFFDLEHATTVLMIIIICGFNILLVIDIALLLFPQVGSVNLIRPEYAFALFSVTVLASAIANGINPVEVFQYDTYKY